MPVQIIQTEKKPSVWDKAIGTLKGAAGGASAGATLGPLGALIGAAGGGAAGEMSTANPNNKAGEIAGIAEAATGLGVGINKAISKIPSRADSGSNAISRRMESDLSPEQHLSLGAEALKAPDLDPYTRSLMAPIIHGALIYGGPHPNIETAYNNALGGH